MGPDRQSLEELRIDRSAPRRSGRAGWVIGIVLLLALVCGGLVWFLNRPKPTLVRTISVAGRGGQDTGILLNGSGYVTARRESTVSSKVTGKVVEVLVEEGMKVELGQVLARIDSINVEKSLRLAEAQLESARKAQDEIQVNLEKADRELRRINRLAVEEIASKSELDRAEADAKSMKARLTRQEAEVTVADREVALWKQQMEDTVIRAPFTGIVTSKNAQPGEMISPMSAGGFTRTGICTIVDMSSLEIEVDVNESYINLVKSGQPVEATLDSYPEWRIPTHVIAIIPTADRVKATVKVRVGFEKMDPRILPHMSVKVAFQNATGTKAVSPGLTIPKSALQQRDGRDLVWVVRNGVVERRAVTLGATRGDQVAVVAGLIGGEKLVTDAPVGLNDGARVTESK